LAWWRASCFGMVKIACKEIVQQGLISSNMESGASKGCWWS